MGGAVTGSYVLTFRMRVGRRVDLHSFSRLFDRWCTLVSIGRPQKGEIAVHVYTMRPETVLGIARGRGRIFAIRVQDAEGNEVPLSRSAASIARAAQASPPLLVLRLLPAADALRYQLEWGAHLLQLCEEGEEALARRHRRRLLLAAPRLALELHVRAAIRRRRTR
jgi:hypothetical protein